MYFWICFDWIYLEAAECRFRECWHGFVALRWRAGHNLVKIRTQLCNGKQPPAATLIRRKEKPAGRLPAGSKPNSYQLDYLIGTKPTWATMRWPAEPIVKSRNSLATP